jgi:hypothetical protein
MFSVFGKRFNALFVTSTNLAFGVMLYHTFSAELSLAKMVFLESVLIGNSFIIYQNFKFNDKLWSLISLQLQVGILLMSLPNILLSFVGLILVIFSFSRSFDRKKEFILNSAISIWLLVFCLLVSSWSNDFSIASLKNIINNYLVLIGFLYFFLVYGLWRCFYEVSSISKDEFESTSQLSITTWLWIGIFNNFILLLFNDLEIIKENTHLVGKTAMFIFSVLMILVFLKIENVKSTVKHISYTIISQAAIISYLIIDHSRIYLSWMIYTNACLILFLLFFRTTKSKFVLIRRVKLKFIAQLILIILFVGLPFSPWFDSTLILLKHLKEANTPVIYLLGLVFLGVRFRQNTILLINFIRLNHSKESKAS